MHVRSTLPRRDRSISAAVHMFAGASIAALSFLQNSLAINTHASEVLGASSAAVQPSLKPAEHLNRAVYEPERATPLRVDSRSTLPVALSKASLKKSLYIVRRAMFLQQAVEGEDIQVYSCKSQRNIADVLTKPTSWKPGSSHVIVLSSSWVILLERPCENVRYISARVSAPAPAQRMMSCLWWHSERP